MKTILLSGPGKNALSTSLMETTLAAVKAAGDDAVLLTGDGDCFSAGLNLKEVVTLDEAGFRRFLGVLEELVVALHAHPGPMVAWINGHAIAGGCVLALAADVRVMTARENARIGLNEVALGLRFPPLTFAMIRSRLGEQALERVVLEAKLYGAREAVELGIVHAIGEEAEARARLEALAAHPREAYAYAKRTMRGSLVVNEAEQRALLEQTIPYWAAPERKEALRAVLAKR